ncbi:hypothetical protein [Burkholderia ubonensis]|uniref:Type 1 fimbrial protein n=1 Tax=Burkholderia ubonensis TaxID=101571 RepID=A0A1R1J8W8_9BURK|nr:hypothetical protein [Burkholderia ubonensis]OMG71772.1 hypothetical protein BW685_19010 [Burkholderia ubonensis]
MNGFKKMIFAGLISLGGWSAAQAGECVLNINDANVNFGRVFGDRIGDGRGAERRPIATMNRIVSAQCHRAIVMSLRFDGVPSPDERISLGGVAEYVVTVTRISLDGKDVQATLSSTGNALEATSMPISFRPGDAVTPSESNMPAPGKRLEVFIRLDAYRTAEPALNRETTVTSDARFRVVAAH